MSAKESEAPASSPQPANQSKLLTILAGGAFALSLVAVVLTTLLLLRPIAKTIEQGNTEIKEAIDANGSTVGKKIEGLRDACIDWQAVLKTANDKPEAIFKIVKSADGLLLSLTEVKAGQTEGAGTGK